MSITFPLFTAMGLILEKQKKILAVPALEINLNELNALADLQLASVSYVEKLKIVGSEYISNASYTFTADEFNFLTS